MFCEVSMKFLFISISFLVLEVCESEFTPSSTADCHCPLYHSPNGSWLLLGCVISLCAIFLYRVDGNPLKVYHLVTFEVLDCMQPLQIQSYPIGAQRRNQCWRELISRAKIHKIYCLRA